VVKYLFAYTSREPSIMRDDPAFAREIRRSLRDAENNVAFDLGGGVAGAGGKADESARTVEVEIPRPRGRSSGSSGARGSGGYCKVLIRGAANSDACMHKKSPGWDNGNVIHLWDCDAGGRENKVWIFEPATGLIRNAANPDACLHKKFGGWENGNPIHLWDCDAGGPEMKTWRYEPSSGLIRSAVNPRFCMHKKSPGWDNGNVIHLWECDAGTSESKSWRLDAH
jgi:hypothetical protein